MVPKPAWRKKACEAASIGGAGGAEFCFLQPLDLLPGTLQGLAKEKAQCVLKVSPSWRPSFWRHYLFLPPRLPQTIHQPSLPEIIKPQSLDLCHHSVAFLHFWDSVGPRAAWRASASRCTWYPKTNLRPTSPPKHIRETHMLPFLYAEPVTLTAPPGPAASLIWVSFMKVT